MRTKMMPLRSMIAAAPLFALPAIGCGKLIGLEDVSRADTNTLCGESAQPPEASRTACLGPPDAEFWLAVDRVDFGDQNDANGEPRYLRMGYDLDKSCTAQGDRPTCIKAPRPPPDPLDGPGGRDNASGALLYRNNQSEFDSWSDTVTKLSK